MLATDNLQGTHMTTRTARDAAMIRVDPTVHKQLVELAKSEGRKVSYLATQALRELVERHQTTAESTTN